jgi:hypothetical protein
MALLTTKAGRVTVMVWPPTGELAVGAESTPGGGAAAALCVMVNVVPAIVNVALRAAPVFAATANVAVPLPVPEAPAEIVRKAALLVAVHVHPVPAVTGTEPDPPAGPNDDVVMAPVVTVHDGAVVAGLLFSFEQATATSKSAVAANKRGWDRNMEASRKWDDTRRRS